MDSLLDKLACPYDALRPCVCPHEKTLQLLAEVRFPLETAPCQVLRAGSEHERRETAALFVISEPATGRRAVSTRLHRTAADIAEVLACISDVMHPDAEEITVVLDNLNTHTLSSLRNRYSESKTSGLSGTPPPRSHAGSQLNPAENQIPVIPRQCLTRRIADITAPRTKLRA